jgi:hypothetical protein
MHYSATPVPGPVPQSSLEGAARSRWMRSSSCAGNGCLEVSFGPGTVSVRDSKRSDSPVLTYNHDEWQAFLAGVRKGEFDLADS